MDNIFFKYQNLHQPPVSVILLAGIDATYLNRLPVIQLVLASGCY